MIRYPALGLFAALIGPGVSSTLQDVILLSAAAAAVGYLWHKVLFPLGKLIHRTLTAVDHLEAIPEVVSRMERLEGTTIDLSSKVGGLEARVSHVEDRVERADSQLTALLRDLDVPHRDQ